MMLKVRIPRHGGPSKAFWIARDQIGIAFLALVDPSDPGPFDPNLDVFPTRSLVVVIIAETNLPLGYFPMARVSAFAPLAVYPAIRLKEFDIRVSFLHARYRVSD